MAKLTGRPRLDVEIVFVVNEAEARALDALVGYGADNFVAVFYDKLGKSYMRDHEQGLRSLFESVRTMLPPILTRLDDTKAVFDGTRIATFPKAKVKETE